MSFDTLLTEKADVLQTIAKQLRSLIMRIDNRIEETIHGGAKVKIALYHIGNPTQVLYGLQLGKSDCKLYLHHTDKADITGLKLEGSGKHAKHVKFTKALTDEDSMKTARALNSILMASGY